MSTNVSEDNSKNSLLVNVKQTLRKNVKSIDFRGCEIRKHNLHKLSKQIFA